MKNNQFEIVFDLLKENRLAEASGILSQLNPVTNTEHRICGHLKGKIHLCQQNYEMALIQFVDTTVKYGPHIGLRCDMLLCHFQLGDFSRLTDELQKTDRDYEEFKILLSEENQFKTEMFLAKMFEESCLIVEAMAAYQKMSNRVDPRQRRKAMANFLRLQAFFSDGAEIKSAYYSLYKSIPVKYDLEIEVEHALILAELYLFQDTTAESRLQRALAKIDLIDEDRNLLIYDSVELSLLLDKKLDLKLPETQNEFEKNLRHLTTLNMNEQLDISTINFEKMSLYPFLRLLIIILKRSSNTAAIAHEKIVSILETLDLRNRTLLQNRLSEDISTKEWSVEYSISQSTLKVNNKSMKLKPSSANLLIIEAIETESHIMSELFFKKIWNGPYDQSHHDRLRMIVARFNKVFVELCGVKALKFSNDKVIKLGHIKLRRTA